MANVDEKREALLKINPLSQGWRGKINKLNGRDISVMYREYERDGKLVEDEAT